MAQRVRGGQGQTAIGRALGAARAVPAEASGGGVLVVLCLSSVDAVGVVDSVGLSSVDGRWRWAGKFLNGKGTKSGLSFSLANKHVVL